MAITDKRRNKDHSWLPLLERRDPDASVRPLRLRRYVTTAFFLLAGLASTGLVYTAVEQNDFLRAERAFATIAAQRAQSVAKSMAAYEHNLHAVDAFFHASEFVTRHEFRLFVAPLLGALPGTHAIEWIPRVRAGERQSFLASARADGIDFQIKPFHDNSKNPPRAPEGDSYPVYYIEPFAPNALALGIDVGTDPIRREALERARDTAATAATAPIRLVQDAHQEWSTILFLPHYSATAPPQDIEARRETLMGFVLGAIRLTDLLTHATSYFDSTGIDVALLHEGRWLAGTNPEGEATRGPGSQGTPTFEQSTQVHMGGRVWQVRCTPTQAFMAAQESLRPLLSISFGLVATLLVSGFFYATTRGAEFREALAQSEERYRTLVEHAPEAILVLSVDQGRFIDANDNACRMFKRSREELKTLSLVDVSAEIQPNGLTIADAARLYLQRAVDGEAPIFSWTHLDGEGNEIPCEIRLVRLPSREHILVRGSITDITERVRTEQHQQLMMRELDHRVKNNLATVLSLTEQSASNADSVEELRTAIADRIHAMADIHYLLATQQWQEVEMGDLVRITLTPYQSTPEKIRTSGPPLILGPDVCSALSMVLHELATNAAKYGALSAARGCVELVWRAENDGLTVDWTESGGPTVRKPDRSGYGSQLITGLIEHQLGGKVELKYRAEGLRCRLHIPLKVRQGDAGDGSQA